MTEATITFASTFDFIAHSEDEGPEDEALEDDDLEDDDLEDEDLEDQKKTRRNL